MLLVRFQGFLGSFGQRHLRATQGVIGEETRPDGRRAKVDLGCVRKHDLVASGEMADARTDLQLKD